MNSEEKFVAPQVKLDEEGFFKSFNVNNCSLQEIAECYSKYGLVIFRDVITPQEIQLSIDDLWNDTMSDYNTSNNIRLIREDPTTWNCIKGWQKNFGFVGQSVIDQKQFWKNRKNQNVYKCFKKTYQASSGKPLTEPLICNFDRGSMILPAGVNPEWRSKDLYHFDIDPWLWVGLKHKVYRQMSYEQFQVSGFLGEGNYTPNVGYTKLAGVLAFSDTTEDSGGFSCACGFQNYIKAWCQKNYYMTGIEEDQNLMKNFSKVFFRKGSLLVFSRQLPHNIYPNQSKNIRYAQYLRMSPLSSLCLDAHNYQARKQLVKKLIPTDLDISDPISKQIFMIQGNFKDGQNCKKGNQNIQEKLQKKEKPKRKKFLGIF